MNQQRSFSKESTKLSTMADEVAAKAKRVFELMDSQNGTKAFGSVIGTDILITIERVKTDRPAWWPSDLEWPPTLSDAEALRAVAEGIPCTPEDVAAEELRQQREGTFEIPESLRDADKVLERIKAMDPEDPYVRCESFEDCCKVMFDTNTAMRKFFGKQ
jgi:hypothetical protein